MLLLKCTTIYKTSTTGTSNPNPGEKSEIDPEDLIHS